MKKMIVIVLGMFCVILPIIASGNGKSRFPACFNKSSDASSAVPFFSKGKNFPSCFSKPFVDLSADQIEKDRKEEDDFHMTIKEASALVALKKKSEQKNDIQNPYSNHTPILRFNSQGELERIPDSDKK